MITDRRRRQNDETDKLIAQRQRLLGRDGAHVVKLLEQRVGELDSRRIAGSICFSRLTSLVTMPQSLLYFL